LVPEERRQICLVAAEQLGLNPGSVEKEFWVCWTLRELFSLPGIGEHLTFKGGTSLSKGWKLIERFSEDIDVVIDRDALGFDGERSPVTAAGSNERRRRLEALRTACQTWIRDVLRPALDRRCLIRSGTADAAVADPDLFNRVVAHRGVFFRRSAEAQATLRPGSLRIMPTREHYPAWQRDYDAMREAMFFGETPEFVEILMVVEGFQNKFNQT